MGSMYFRPSTVVISQPKKSNSFTCKPAIDNNLLPISIESFRAIETFLDLW